MITRTPVQWMLLPLMRYPRFSGRAPRAEYWWLLLLYFLAGAAAGLIMAFTGVPGIDTVVQLLFALPVLTVSVRRLHDVDRTGWWVVAPMVPLLPAMGLAGVAGNGDGLGGVRATLLVGGGAALFMLLMLQVWYCERGTVGPNRFGPDPLAEGGEGLPIYS